MSNDNSEATTTAGCAAYPPDDRAPSSGGDLSGIDAAQGILLQVDLQPGQPILELDVPVAWVYSGTQSARPTDPKTGKVEPHRLGEGTFLDTHGRIADITRGATRR